MIDINNLSEKKFLTMPLVIEGESKIVRYAGQGMVVIKFKPTIHSHTAKRTGIAEGSDILRLRLSKIFVQILQDAGIAHANRDINDKWVLSELVLQPKTEYNPNPFIPDDLSLEEIEKLSVAPPIETIIKRMHTGTSKHRYYGMSGSFMRKDHPLYREIAFHDDEEYPQTIVRFDWRNPLTDTKGNRLADEVMPNAVADWFINIIEAEKTALQTFQVVNNFLFSHNIVCCDLCLIIAQDGKKIFGEISQDCGRFRHRTLGSLDKDIWRAGNSEKVVLQKWKVLLETIMENGKY